MYRAALATEPFAYGLFLAILALLAGFAVYQAFRGNNGRAFACVVLVILVNLVTAFGEDIDHHLYRIVALAEQLRLGRPSLLLTDPASGEALPTFVFYSFLPYLPAVLLDLAGVSAHSALKIVMAAQLLIMAFGLRRLVERVCEDRAISAGYLVAILFLCANYVYGLWLTRMAFAEIWVYCLIPWTVVFLLDRSTKALTALFFLQVAAHPIVFGQALASTLLVAACLSNDPPLAVLRRCVAPLIIALVAAAPFWLPQLLWLGVIVGPAGLPVRFADSFLSPAELFDRRFERGLGFALPLAILLMIAIRRARLRPKSWVLVAVFVAGLAIQTPYLLPFARQVPLLATSLFVWRLMLPVAIVGLGALLAGWQPGKTGDRLLASLALLSGLSMLVVLAGAGASSIPLAQKPASDETWYRSYLAAKSVWGRQEFLPNYASLHDVCARAAGESRTVSYDALRGRIKAGAPYLVVPAAPVGFVDYTVDGVSMPPSACRGELVLGPLKPESFVQAREGTLDAVLWLRIACLAAFAAVLSLAAVVGTRAAVTPPAA